MPLSIKVCNSISCKHYKEISVFSPMLCGGLLFGGKQRPKLKICLLRLKGNNYTPLPIVWFTGLYCRELEIYFHSFFLTTKWTFKWNWDWWTSAIDMMEDLSYVPIRTHCAKAPPEALPFASAVVVFLPLFSPEFRDTTLSGRKQTLM